MRRTKLRYGIYGMWCSSHVLMLRLNHHYDFTSFVYYGRHDKKIVDRVEIEFPQERAVSVAFFDLSRLEVG